jgi:putative ABC transport system permease protein
VGPQGKLSREVRFLKFVIRTATFYWRTNLAVVLGVATAVSVLAGALIVGDSVRGSLRDLALGRLGRTDTVVSSTGFFRDGLAADVKAASGVSGAAPLIVASGFVTHEASGRRASNVLVYGVDERFWSFNGEASRDGVFLSPALALELGALEGDVLLARAQKPSAIPVESLFGRKEDVGRTLRLQLSGTLPREHLGEFALQPQQAEVRALFAPLRRIQRDLAVQGRVNTVLVSGAHADERAVAPALKLDDLEVRVGGTADGSAIVVESGSGIIAPALETATRKAAERLHTDVIPVFTYLANTIRHGDRQIPYSLITATNLDALPQVSATAGGSGPAKAGRGSAPAKAGRYKPVDSGQRTAAAPGASGDDAIVLNDWAAGELQAAPGDRIDVDYYLWSPADGLQTRTASFVLSRVVPIAGLAADRRLAPEYPGITAAKSLGDWDPPFPIDLSRVRPVDEKYWDEHRTTPKAFIPYARGRELWQSRYGALTSMRLAVPAGSDVTEASKAIGDELRGALSPASLGVTTYPARAAALQAATGATDFGEYFTYFSFFLVVSALLLVVLFFKLGIEQRLRQIGILRASGYTIASLRGLLLSEAVVLAVAGALIGLAGAVAYGRVIMYALTTWWIGAVGTTLLTLHVSWPSLVIGAAGGALAAILCVVVSLRSVGKLTPRSLLTAQAIDTEAAAGPLRRGPWMVILFTVLGVLLLAYGFADRTAQAGAFFGAGAALLVACLLFFSRWLRFRDRRLIAGRGTWAVSRLGFRSASFRPARSVLSAALIASAAFIIVSVDAFRRGGAEISSDPHSGTGGFVLLAQSEIPLLHNPNDAAGRDALLIRAPELSPARFTRFRLRQGQDASCLNLYRPTNPTIIAPEPAFVESNRFTFGSSLASTDAERANPWLLLERRADDGAVPVIADATSLQYVLHASVGDRFSVDIGADHPLNLRFVGALQDSVLQGQLVMAESRFTELFPQQQGYKFFLIDDPSVHSAAEASALAGIVERELEPFGVDAVTTGERLEAFHRVENTYLSTFQALGGLGLLLGTIGLATVMFRNVLERRRELALLRAVGYDARRVSIMIVAEAVLILTAGLAAGLVCAVLAVAPAWLSRGGTLPGAGLFALLAAVAVAGLLSSLVATRAAVSGGMLEALRAE